MKNASILSHLFLRKQPAIWLATFAYAIVWAPSFLFSTPILAQESEQLSSKEVEFFESRIRPLLVEHCFECHAGKESKGGLRLDSRSLLRQGGDSGASLEPGNPDKSLLLEAVRYKNPDLQMPPKRALSPSQIDSIQQWIEMGAPDPRSDAPMSSNPQLGMSVEEGRGFWSFKPVSDPEVPASGEPENVQTPIDHFLLARLDHMGLKPNRLADKRALIRRATYDLTGLPPTIDEIDTFLNDDRPEAYANLIERLLQSPAYGVRWGRHWLDVARYADSNGLDENLAYGTAWRYRDYVVNAFIQDKPFDRFLIEQVAGDLIPDATLETRTATGFLVLGAKVLAEPDREKLMMDTIDEQIDTLGKAFMGMTLGCVRCHDHKFDPIKQTDYYGLAAIFKSTKTFGDTNLGAIKHWNEHPFASESEKKSIQEVEAKIAQLKKVASDYKGQAYRRIGSEARSKATDYLVAASLFGMDATLPEIESLATPRDLHPRILHHCRRFLEYQREHPFFQKWHASMESKQPEEIESHYRPILENALKTWEEARAKDSSVKKLDDPGLEMAREALFDPSGFLTIPAKPEFALSATEIEEFYRLSEEARLFESFAPDIASTMAVSDGSVQSQIPIHVRGSHRNLGAAVLRSLPEVMTQPGVVPVFPRTQSGRLELAQWMASSSHPLTARVYVNRLWGWHFGQPLIKSTENFGKLGEPPSHPELLDWLARYFMETGWSTKGMHRLIMNSRFYQLSCDESEEAKLKDPENRSLSHFSLQRLDAEQIRDSILMVTGCLDRTIGGKTVPLRNRQFVFDHTSIDHTKYDSLRRTLYLPVIRNNLCGHLEQFDFPDPTMPTGHRNVTSIATQSLAMLNAVWVLDASEAMAKELLITKGTSERIHLAFERCLGRAPSQAELDKAVAFLDEAAAVGGEEQTGESSSSETLDKWSMFCQSLFVSNEFFYLR